MSRPDFRRMSPEEFRACRPRDEDQADDKEKEGEFRNWCKENDEDPMDDSARDSYNEMQKELGEFWDNADPDDRAGYEDNMNKD